MDKEFAAYRKRLQSELKRFGLGSLSDIEMLELWLSYCCRGKDVRALARALFERLGSFSGVFEAGAEQLAELPGCTEEEIDYLAMIPEFCRRQNLKWHCDITFTNTYSAKRYTEPMFLRDGRVPMTRILCLNAGGTLRGCYEIAKGPLQLTREDVADILHFVARRDAVNVIMAHRHLRSGAPDQNEIDAMARIVELLNLMRVRLYDYILIFEGGAASMMHNILLMHPECETVPL